MSNPGDIAPRCDTDSELYVVVVSNEMHLAADTGRVITCPYIPGKIPDTAMAMVVSVIKPEGAVLPELVQWLPTVALDAPFGNVGPLALQKTTALVKALLS